ncbi:MAG: SDH family Clp fold serine proteinase, partial [Hyphomonas sp.]
IALAADEIVMCRHSVLGPIDPQLNGMPAASVIRVAEGKPIAEVEDQTLILADVGRKSIAQVTETARGLLAERMGAEAAAALATRLATGIWTHDYPISAAEAKEMGLPVSLEMPAEVIELMTLYPQPVRRQAGGVEYLPARRQRALRQ